jgi:hypothetical protein
VSKFYKYLSKWTRGRAKATEGYFMTLTDLEMVKEELEEINRRYRNTHTLASRLELVERVKNLMMMIKDFETDVGSSVLK